MKTIATALFFFLLSSTLGQTVNIPDANFKAYLVGNTSINTNSDTEIQVSEAQAFSGTIDCDDMGISDLTGIEAFTSLDRLKCQQNQLSTLDISENTMLTDLYCSYNNLTSLDVSNNTALEILSFPHNQITSIDVSNCADLLILQCYNNDLTSIDISNNIDLVQFSCYFNNLSSLDVSNNTALERLECQDNGITSLDVSNNVALKVLYCDNNQLPSLDISTNTAIYTLICNNNLLTSLNVANGNNTNFTSFKAFDNPDLTCIQVDDASYSDANWRGGSFWAGSDIVYSEDCSCTVNIPDATFKAYLVGLTPLNTNGDGEIQCSEAESYSGAINYANKTQVDLTGLEKLTSLTYLNCFNLNLTSLDLSQNTSLVGLNCYDNQLTSLDLSNNLDLTELDCHGNNITSLDINGNTNLQKVYVYDNDLSSLDVSTLTNLIKLRCYNNNLTELDVSNNTLLENFYCSGNAITSLDVSNNASLKILYVKSNALTSFNAKNGNNGAITTFTAVENPDLDCIEVDDASYSTANWTDVDEGTSFSEDCSNFTFASGFYTEDEISVFPNPTNGSFAIESNSMISLSIYNSMGVRIYQSNASQYSRTLDLSGEGKGVYMLHLSTGRGTAIKKLVVE